MCARCRRHYLLCESFTELCSLSPVTTLATTTMTTPSPVCFLSIRDTSLRCRWKCYSALHTGPSVFPHILNDADAPCVVLLEKWATRRAHIYTPVCPTRRYRKYRETRKIDKYEITWHIAEDMPRFSLNKYNYRVLHCLASAWVYLNFCCKLAWLQTCQVRC